MAAGGARKDDDDAAVAAAGARKDVALLEPAVAAGARKDDALLQPAPCCSDFCDGDVPRRLFEGTFSKRLSAEEERCIPVALAESGFLTVAPAATAEATTFACAGGPITE